VYARQDYQRVFGVQQRQQAGRVPHAEIGESSRADQAQRELRLRFNTFDLCKTFLPEHFHREILRREADAGVA
jgi:hypothetical protein